jgi:hypothetical protein
MSKDIGNKLASRLKDRIAGMTVDPVIEVAFDKIVDLGIDIGIKVLEQMKSTASAERKRQAGKTEDIGGGTT